MILSAAQPALPIAAVAAVVLVVGLFVVFAWIGYLNR
jgi:hypothetical protein